MLLIIFWQLKKTARDLEASRIIQILSDSVLVGGEEKQKTRKKYGEGITARYKGNFVTIKIDSRKISKEILSRIELLLEEQSTDN
ncbi:hypothetical protein [Escherichia coli]|uniref:hypothetical protein n=1 Tax=Escherichia coli TaxID=562 RepID=UPI002FCCC0CB